MTLFKTSELFKTSGHAGPREMLSRRRFIAGSACAVAAASMAAPATANIQTLVYDELAQRWVAYDEARAQRQYEREGLPEVFRKQVVDFRTAEAPGTIIVDGDKHFLYLVLPDFKALRYGIAVGKEGFGWAGIVRVGRKVEWPTWTPPPEMIARAPHVAKWANGMPGGPDNPLGARAIYLLEGGLDTLYRIHGTINPWGIGLNLSSGCIQLRNEDVTDLYERVAIDAKVIVLMQGAALYRGI
jgi:lipoprotein-anchoring transpeptidase ErfK/SrfK